MTTPNQDLWERLKRFSLDSAEAVLPFSARLARENGWSAAHTRRVIVEYKRFAFLAVAAGHPVSPPEDVDQVWHLHLTYSEDYWNVFCPEVLGRPLHHHPSRGGLDERDKFHDWYARTLASYEAHFGEPPPADIWPSAEARAAESHRFQRVDRERAWVIRKPRVRIWPWGRSVRRTGEAAPFAGIPPHPLPAFAAAAMLLVVCGGAILGQASNPLDLRGPDFLKFYLGLVLVCFGVAASLRWSLRQPAGPPADDASAIEPYAIAYLNGGRVLAVNAALANLANQNLLRFDAQTRRIYDACKLPRDAHPLERAIQSPSQALDFAASVTFADVRNAARPAVESIADDLKERGLVVSDDQARKAIWLPLLISSVAPVLGAIKVWVGMSRGKPVGILVAFVIISAVVALIAFARRPLRTRHGDATLNQLRSEHARLSRLEGRASSVSSREFATAVGLFGLVALAGTPLADLRRTLQPPGGSSGCGSACGGGGGGGCGGGGGGGGGCGGCSGG